MTLNSTMQVCELLSKAVERKNTYLLICGDFNYREIDWENESSDEKNEHLTTFMDLGVKFGSGCLLRGGGGGGGTLTNRKVSARTVTTQYNKRENPHPPPPTPHTHTGPSMSPS